MNINIRKILSVQAFHQAAEFCKSTQYTVDPKSTHPRCQLQSRAKTQRETFKRFQTENNDRNKALSTSLSIFPCVTHS